MQKNKQGVFWFGMTGLIMLTFFIGGIIIFNIHIKDKVSKTTNATLEEIIMQQAYNFNSKIEDEMATLKLLASGIANSPNVHNITNATIKRIGINSPFDYITVVDKNYMARYSDGEVSDLSDRDYIHKALAGETVLSEPVASKVRNAQIIVIATPILYQGEVIGVLTGSHLSDALSQLFLPSFSGKGYVYVAKNDGKIVTETKSEYSLLEGDNIFDALRTADFISGDHFEVIQRKVIANEPGKSIYTYHGQTRMMHYMPLGINDWDIFSIVPEDVVTKDANEITLVNIIVSGVIIVVMTALIFGIILMQRRSLKQIERIAFVDELTKASTLPKFKLDAQERLSENKDKRFIIIKLDVDNFKMINQMYGYAEGDRLLIAIAKAISSRIPNNVGIFARLNTDEFIIMHEYHSDSQLKKNRSGLVEVIRETMGEGFQFNLFIPTGRYLFSAAEIDGKIAAAIERVNFAHRQAKQNHIVIYDYDDTVAQEARRKKEIENKMESALQSGAFKMYLQAKRYLADESLAGAEALVRWEMNGKIIPPGEFIPVFEQNGFVTKLDLMMFEEACKFISNLITTGKPPLVISVNFSRLHIRNEKFVDTLCKISDRLSTPRRYLEIEITETAILDNEDVFNDVLLRLHEAGFTLSMDDFGTGYSTLGLLKNIDFDVIKIDRSFFTSGSKPQKTKSVLSNVIKMAKDLGIKTVAEGVENQEHIDLLRELGCDIVQGYYYARPVSAQVFFKETEEQT